ncbi:hypothetical protein [Falsiroseomonas oryziterrae]|uniref:hypothetical protein n=1 Tax=Falsiroseomonas oryziterrae TaxID=2911368 RepID=UPI001F27D061|nr:hypothetical protein [Roseomonas sp. NPKOSM-4]
MPERFDVYRFEVAREGAAPEIRYSLAPMKGVRYAGRGEPLGAEPQDNGPDETEQHEPAGTVEAPDGTTPASLDPPILDIPGHGRVDLHAVIGATEGSADDLGHLLRWRPRR